MMKSQISVTSVRAHLKTQSGEKSNKCNQCDYKSSRAGTVGALYWIPSHPINDGDIEINCDDDDDDDDKINCNDDDDETDLNSLQRFASRGWLWLVGLWLNT